MYMMNDREFSNRKETLHGEFYENALKYPERIALIYENEKVSYKMLRLYALRAANYMWQRGVRRNDKIVVILPRGIGQVAALLGILDEILRASLTMPTIMGIAQYISDCKNPSKNQMHSNAGNQTRNSYTVVYIFGDNENEIRDVLIEKLSASNISCKRVGGQEIIERCHEDISVKKKYIIAFSEMASLCITKASELLGENIIINRIFLINPSKAKESDLYLGDISIIDGNSVAIKSWEKAVLGNVREFESNSNDIFDIIMRELENDK